MRLRRAAFLAALIVTLPLLAAVSAAQSNIISMTNTASPNPGIVGRDLTFSMNVINDTPDVLTGVVVTDTLPPDVVVTRAVFGFQDRPRADCDRGMGTITCNIGTLGVGRLEGAGVSITVRPTATGRLSNTATVTSNGTDPNEVTVETDVEPQVNTPVTMDLNLAVSTAASGVMSPTGIAFLGANDFLVLEKNGKVQRVTNGVVTGTVLSLAVNSASERGLLAIALHPNFAVNRFVYLYWTCRGPEAGADCDPMVGDPTPQINLVPLLGNRVDRFIWDGSRLTFDRNIIRLRSYQADAAQPQRGNHNGGKILFGADEKLYIYMGDNGRRGWLQNVLEGFGPGGTDDQFGGPEPDDAHLTGMVLRLNDDGGTPADNPFLGVMTGAGEEVDANIHKLFAYGIRNGFGLAFDPITGQLWESQNGDDSGSEINRIEAGFNGGWVQIMGRLERIGDYKAIETSPVYFGLQQIRWSPTQIADSPREALARMFMLPGAQYVDPRLTWKFEIAPAGFGFVGRGLGPEYEGNIVLGGARDFLLDGHLFRLKLTPDRMDLDLSNDPQLNQSRVIEAQDKWDITGSESLLFGKGFGLTSDVLTGPNGNLFVVSLSKNAVYEIRRR